MSGFSCFRVVNAQAILVNAPLVLDTPARDKNIMAFHDGEQFWIDVTGLATHIGYETLEADSMHVTLRDASRVMIFDGQQGTVSVNQEIYLTTLDVLRGPDGEMLISLSALSAAFGSDLDWDESALTLRLSTNPVLFNPGPNPSTLTKPAKLVFPRELGLLGGLHIYYDASHQWSQIEGSQFSVNARASAAVAWGVLRANLSLKRPSASYAVELNHPWLTSVSASWRKGDELPGFQMTNVPLIHPRIFAERIHSGVTIPHAIVRASLGGNQSDQVQADGEGRYAIALPVYYGTTRSELDVTPLGQPPLTTQYGYELTPQTSIRKGHLQYHIEYNHRWTASVAYGINDRLTVRTDASTDPYRARIGSTARLLRSLYLEVESDPIDQSANAKIRQWRNWGEYEVGWQRFNDSSQSISGSGYIQSGALSFSSNLTHHRSTYRDPYTRLTPTLGWQFPSGIRAQLRSRITLGAVADASLNPNLSWVLSLGRARIRVSHGAEVISGQIHDVSSTIRIARRDWNFSVSGQQDLYQDQTTVSASVQFNTDWAWLGMETRMIDEDILLTQRARGTIGIDQGITLSAIAQDNAQARFRIFVDKNLNGVLDENEDLLDTPEIKVNSYYIMRRWSGELYTKDLSPNQTYTVTIIPESIRDPMLYPITGYRFGFVAQAGRTRRLDIALQPLPLMQGRITGWNSAHELLRITVIGSNISRELDVYRDGGFFALLPPDEYEFTVSNLLTDDVILQKVYRFDDDTSEILISLGP